MMTDQEMNEFLDQRLVGALATLRGDGAPNLVPIWYRWTGREITVFTSPKFEWLRRLQSDPRVAFSVFEHDAPRRAVYIRGIATVAVGPLAALKDDIRAICARYVDAADLDGQMAAFDNGTEKAVVTITPSFVKAEYN